jgi:hypothetical protein
MINESETLILIAYCKNSRESRMALKHGYVYARIPLNNFRKLRLAVSLEEVAILILVRKGISEVYFRNSMQCHVSITISDRRFYLLGLKQRNWVEIRPRFE